MVRNFRGQVRISEVKAELDSIVNRINAVVDAYNESALIADIDYNNVSGDIAPSGFTLSVGALKKVIEAYNGARTGSFTFKSPTTENPDNTAITAGYYINEEGGSKLQGASLTLTDDVRYLCYNADTQTYSFANDTNYDPVTNGVILTAINPKRYSTKNISTSKFWNGGLSNYKIYSQTKNVYPRTNETINTANAPIFVSGNEVDMDEGKGTAITYIFGQEVGNNRQTGHRNKRYWQNNNKLYLPKGSNNPISHNDGWRSADKTFGVIVKKNGLKQQS